MAPGRRSFVIRIGDTDVAAELADGQVRIGAAEPAFDVDTCGDGEYLVRDGIRTWRVFVAGPPDGRYVYVDGVSAIVEVAPAGRPAVRRQRAETAATAPMPATVIEILVVTGQSVEAGEVLLTLEAMKMEMPVRAPRSGSVTHIHCVEGELVQPGVVLVEVV